MDFKAIQELMRSMSDSNLSYLEVEENGTKITMKKEIEGGRGSNTGNIAEAVSPQVIQKVIENVSPIASTEKVEENYTGLALDESNIYTVVSPIVGTFYGSSSPQTANFVEVGSKVKKGDTLCIVEAMKLMNDIVSEVDGEITQILIENEDMVEYGQELFKIKLG